MFLKGEGLYPNEHYDPVLDLLVTVQTFQTNKQTQLSVIIIFSILAVWLKFQVFIILGISN